RGCVARLPHLQHAPEDRPTDTEDYEKSRRLAALVTFIAVMGALPYIALQLQSVATTFDYLASSTEPQARLTGSYGVFIVAVILAVFSIFFGTRHLDITKYNRGMITAISFDSVIKLAALIAVGAFAIAVSDGGAPPLETRPVFDAPVAIDRFLTLTLISMTAVLCLPRQFHVTVVECQDRSWVSGGANIFLVYLLIITALVVPIAQAGSAMIDVEGVNPDLTVLALPLAGEAQWLALFVFVGGFAAATAMVIVASVALSTMVANDLVAPLLVRASGQQTQIGARLLIARRLSIIVIMMTAALFAAYAPPGEQLASFGILSFAAVAQFAPALLGALYWRGARLEGALTGLIAGFAIWTLALFTPSYFGADAAPILMQLSWLDFTGWDMLTRGVALSLVVNIALYISVSLLSREHSPAPSATDLKQQDFAGAPPRVQAGDFYMLIQRCLGEYEAQKLITEFEAERGRTPDPERSADSDLITFADQQMSKAIGAASASILSKSVLAGGSLHLDDVATLVGETSDKLSFSQELLQTALENISHGVSVIDRDLKLVAWNRAYAQMYAYPSHLLRDGAPVAELIRFNAERGECGPGDVEDHVRRRLSHLRAGKRHTAERMRPDGRVVRIEGMRSPSGAYVTTFTDVSEYKRIEKALINSERSIRFYTDNIPSMVAFADTKEVIQFANSAYRKNFKLEESDVGAVTLENAMGPSEYRIRKPYIDTALSGKKTSFDIEIDGERAPLHMQVTYVPQFRTNGDVRGFFGLYQDVTARRRAEAELAETNETLESRVFQRTQELSEVNTVLEAARREAEQATASKTRFLAAASHDVLQPLNAARLFVSALREEAGGNNGIAALADKTDASIASADRLLRTLLNISKLDAGGVRPEISAFPLQSVFDELANEFKLAASEKGLNYSAIKTSLWVCSDRGLLFSALQNIIANAIRYTDTGRVLIGARRRRDSIRIDIIDTGRGIPETEQQDVFQEFRRLDRDRGTDGAGLGLAMVERIAKLLDTPIALTSTVGSGTHFSLTMARAAPQSLATQVAAEAPAPARLSGLRVLCIDNDVLVRDATKALLTRWGCVPQCFTSDQDVLAETAAGAAPPDLLLLDYQLDDDRTGFDALKALETRWKRRPVTIMITASMSPEMKAEAEQARIPVLAKPVEPAELRAMINQFLRQAAE
ncbi:MAG: PAS-domain containing protein, partial [Pseudomonadota bacterium]